jgi:co-chaperonin GroES (HSP10)
MIKPINDIVVIRELAPEENKVGSLVIPVTAAGKEPVRKGIVVASGPGIYTNHGILIKNETKKDDIVLFSSFNYKTKVDGEELYVAKEGTILAILEA